MSEIVLNTRDLSAAVGAMSGGAPNAAVLLTIHGDRLTVARDGEICAVRHVSGIGKSQPVTVAADFAALKRGIASVPRDSITLRVKGHGLLVEGERMSSRVPLLPEVMPLLSHGEVAWSLSIDAARWAEAVERTVYCVGESGRRGLDGLYMAAADGALRLVATDGHRLAMSDAEAVGSLHIGNSVVPAGLAHAIGALSGLLEIGTVSGRLHARSAGGEVSGPMIAGEFPDYHAVIPKDGSATWSCVFLRKTMTEALRALLASSEHARTHCTTLDASDGSVRLSLVSGDSEWRGEVPADTERGVWLGVNAGYLADAVGRLGCDRVRVSGSDVLAPFVVEPADETPARAVVMPMRVD